MVDNNIILNRLFTGNMFTDLIRGVDNTTYGMIVKRYLDDPADVYNGTLISEIYNFMSREYRNEYIFQNTLLNKLLLGKHNLNTTTALTQIYIGGSKADFILINGKAVVYEIKTELDTFDRLDAQLKDYSRAFDHVCVVTSENQHERALDMLSETSVGIYVLTRRNTISTKLRKEPTANSSNLDHTTIFKVLRKHEYENILLHHCGNLPTVPQVFYFNECLRIFSQIPILEAYDLALKQLKKRNRILNEEFEKVPYELKSLLYFSKHLKTNWTAVNKFLNRKYG